MKKENHMNAEQIKEIREWLLSEIEKVTKDINRCYAMSNYSRAERAEGARDAYYRFLNEIIGTPPFGSGQGE